MFARLNNPVRAVLLAAALAFAAHTPDVRAQSEQVQTAARSTARTRTDAPAASARDESPVDGLLIIAGIVGAVIVLAWVCSRFGDNH